MNPKVPPTTGTPVVVPHALSPTGDALAGGGELSDSLPAAINDLNCSSVMDII